MRLYYHFLSFILQPLNEFNTTFQADESRIGYLAEEMSSLLRKFYGKFIKARTIQATEDLTTLCYSDHNNQLSDSILAIGLSTRAYLADHADDISSTLQTKFFRQCYDLYTNPQRCPNVVCLLGTEDEIRKAIYDDILRELSKVADDNDFTENPDIYDILTLTSNPISGSDRNDMHFQGRELFQNFIDFEYKLQFGTGIHERSSSTYGTAYDIGQRLAMISDDIFRDNDEQFELMVKRLNIEPETAYGVFSKVAEHMFSDGILNRGRIAVLLSFGLRLTIHVVKKSFENVTQSVYSAYNTKENIFSTDQVNMTRNRSSSKGRFIAGTVVFSGVLIASFFMHR